MDIRAPTRLQLGGGANTQDRAEGAAAVATNAVTNAIAPHLAAARHAIQRREIITTVLAEAIDNCMTGFKSPEDAGIANDLRRLVIQAIASSVTNTGSNTSLPASNTSLPDSGSDSSGAYSNDAKRPRKTYVEAAASPLEESDYSTLGSTSQSGYARTPPARTTHARQDEDIRILLKMSTAIRLLDPVLMAIR